MLTVIDIVRWTASECGTVAVGVPVSSIIRKDGGWGKAAFEGSVVPGQSLSRFSFSANLLADHPMAACIALSLA
jgi:hypothetical protein